MLRSAKEIKGYELQALDDEIGGCKDFLFDDRFWTIRYMVVDTGKWLPGRLVLVSPIALDEPNWQEERFPVRLTTQQIKEAPALDEAKPVSRQYEIEYYQYYGWPYYWGGMGAWGGLAYPGPLFEQKRQDDKTTEPGSGEDHLRSIDEVRGYHIQATDDEIGHVEDFILDDATWTIRYMVVDTRNWLPGRKVLISPEWIDSIDWAERKVTVDLSRQRVKDSPEYDPSMPLDVEYEHSIYDFYGRPKYWVK